MNKDFGETEFYRKKLHSKLLCRNKECDICHPPRKCHETILSYDTGGNPIKGINCYCGTTGCKNLTGDNH